MYDEDDIAEATDARTFRRGQSIVMSGVAIQGKECRFLPFETEVSAYVLSSSGWGEHYETEVCYTTDGELEYSCTCPAYMKSDSMCKHCVALALDFLEHPETYHGWERNPVPQTSPELLDLISRMAQEEDAEFAGTVELLPEVVFEWGTWSVGYRIVAGDADYVIKDLAEFASALASGDTITFGKKLTLTLSPACFTEQARSHAGFISRMVRRIARRSRVLSSADRRFGSPSTRGMAGRLLALEEEDAAELFGLIGDGSFQFKNASARSPYTYTATFSDTDPQLPLRIVEDRDGYTLVPEDTVYSVRSGDELYIFYDETLYRCSAAYARSMGDFLKQVYEPQKDLFVSEKDMPLFGATLLDVLERSTALEAPASLERYRRVPGEAVFLFDRVDDRIEVTARVFYGETVYHLAVGPSAIPTEVEILRDVQDGVHTRALIAGIASPDELTSSEGALRDVRLETAALNLLSEYFLPDATIPLDDTPAAGDFLFQGLSRFKSLGEVYTTPAFDRLIVDRKPRLSIGLSLAGNLIDLNVSNSDLSPEELAAVLSSYRRRKHYHRLADGRLLDLESLDLAEFDRMIDDLGIDPAMLQTGSVQLPTYRAFYLNRELEDAVRSDSFLEYLDRFDGQGVEVHPLPEGLAATLRPYQVAGFEWMSTLLDMGLGGILADEMGLGKTVQLIALLLARAEEAREVGPSLIVCPASLVFNWVAEFERFAPSLNVRAVTGDKAARERIRNEEGVDVFITSYDLVRCDRKNYADREFYLCVLDEAQYIKNHATLTTRAVKSLQARHRLALTGTPVENRLSELWSLFDFLMPGILGQYMKFRERFEAAIIGGDEDATARFQALVAPFVLRRLKRSVMPELPDKLEQTVYVPLSGEQRKLYDANEQALRQNLGRRKRKGEKANKVEVLAELTRLRQICCDPALLFENYRGHSAKLDAIEELVAEIAESGSKCLVFSQFTSFLELIAKRLDDRDIPYYTITGSTPKKTRVDLADRFNKDDVPVFLISLKAGGTGLNLTGATTVIHADPWWNAAAQNQATDRAHRIGQRETVNVCRVIAKDTIEERILKLQEAKADLAESVVGMSDGSSLATLSADDLLGLLE